MESSNTARAPSGSSIPITVTYGGVEHTFSLPLSESAAETENVQSCLKGASRRTQNGPCVVSLPGRIFGGASERPGAAKNGMTAVLGDMTPTSRPFLFWDNSSSIILENFPPNPEDTSPPSNQPTAELFAGIAPLTTWSTAVPSAQHGVRPAVLVHSASGCQLSQHHEFLARVERSMIEGVGVFRRHFPDEASQLLPMASDTSSTPANVGPDLRDLASRWDDAFFTGWENTEATDRKQTWVVKNTDDESGNGKAVDRLTLAFGGNDRPPGWYYMFYGDNSVKRDPFGSGSAY